MAPSAVHWARRLTLSARRGEAEAGALMLRLLFHRAYLPLPSPSNGGSSSGSSDLLSLVLDGEVEKDGLLQEGDGGRVGYLRGLRRLVERRLDGFERGMEAWGAGEGQGRGEGIVMVFGAIQVRACVCTCEYSTASWLWRSACTHVAHTHDYDDDDNRRPASSWRRRLLLLWWRRIAMLGTPQPGAGKWDCCWR